MTDSGAQFTALAKSEPPAEAAEPRTRRGFSENLAIFVLVILAALSGGLIATYWPWMVNGAETSEMNDRLAALETRVGQIAAGHAPKAAASAFQAERADLAGLKLRVDADEARIDAVEKSGAPADVGARLDATEKTLTQLSNASAARDKSDADLNGRVALLEKSAPPPDLAARVAKLEARDPAAAMRRAASVLALAQLVRVSESDAPFANELSALRSLAPSPEADDLAHYASNGAPTRAMLVEDFPADAILTAERRSHAGDWVSQLGTSFLHLVSVRRIGNVKGKDTESRVARAEYDAKTGDLDAAVVELNRLSGPARAAAEPWLKHAKARLAITRDTRALTTRVIAGLAPQP